MKARHFCFCLFVVVSVALFSSCKVEHPSDVLSPKKMEAVLYDYHLAQVMCNDLNGQDRYKRELYMNYVYEKHHVTRAQVDSSLVWYARNPKELSAIYEHLNARADAEIARLNEKRAEAKRREPVPVEGDSADIWYERRLVLLSTSDLNNLFMFTIPSDSNFQARDKFEWMFDVIFVPTNEVRTDTLLCKEECDTAIVNDSLAIQPDSIMTDTLKNVVSESCTLSKDSIMVSTTYRARLIASLKVSYSNDSIIAIDTVLYDNGRIVLPLQNRDSVAIREVFGSLWYKSSDRNDQIITSSHRLTRYRQQGPVATAQDTLACDSIGVVVKDSVQTDSLREELLPDNK